MRQPTLEALFGVPSTARTDGAAPDALEVYDLFCGAGGFSEGARAAGCRVAFACDSDPEALDTHARNHPLTTHLQCALPCALPLPTDGRRFHLHGSPPCHKFSGINKRSRTITDKAAARNLMNWYLDFALASNATSWSMEQVASTETLAAVERAKRAHGDAVDFEVFDFSALGVPQSRRRLIAGSPEVVERLRSVRGRRRSVPPASVRSVIAKPRGTHLRASKTWKTLERVDGKYKYSRASMNDFCHSIDGVAPTVVSSVLWWVVPSGTGGWHNRLTPKERAALQTFPPHYKWPVTRRAAFQQIANAVPPLVAESMLRGAAR
jgi:DNA (cytosine-5)-methyltransferase 1